MTNSLAKQVFQVNILKVLLPQFELLALSITG